MNLGQIIRDTLPELQQAANGLMTSRVRIHRRTGLTAQDESTGREVPTWQVVHPSLPARFPPGDSGKSRTLTIAGAEVQVALREMHVPYFTPNLENGDLAEVVAGRAAGVVWELVDATAPGDQATAYRLDVVETDRPEEWL